MNILAVNSFIPYPPTDGGRMGINYPLREMSRLGHRITFACLSEPVPTRAHDAMKEWCRLIVVEHSKMATPMGALRSLVNPEPYTLNRFHDLRLVDAVLAEEQQDWDIIEVEGMHNAFNGLALHARLRIPVVLRLHNAESIILDRYRRHHPSVAMRLFLLLDGWKLQRYEAAVTPRFDYMVPVSPVDGEIMRRRAPDVKVRVIQSGVDIDRPLLPGITEEPLSIFWMGALNWPPNQDSLRWFVREVLPLIVREEPRAVLYVIGSNAPADLGVADGANVRVFGFVEDTRTVMQRCPVAVVPLRSGGGIRLKILELLSMRRAVVSTSVGCEGLAVTDELDIVKADTPDDFASAVLRLLRDPARARSLGEEGRRLVTRLYSWQKIAREFEQLYNEILNSRIAHSAGFQT